MDKIILEGETQQHLVTVEEFDTFVRLDQHGTFIDFDEDQQVVLCDFLMGKLGYKDE